MAPSASGQAVDLSARVVVGALNVTGTVLPPAAALAAVLQSVMDTLDSLKVRRLQVKRLKKQCTEIDRMLQDSYTHAEQTSMAGSLNNLAGNLDDLQQKLGIFMDYSFVKRVVKHREIGDKLDELHGKLFGWVILETLRGQYVNAGELRDIGTRLDIASSKADERHAENNLILRRIQTELTKPKHTVEMLQDERMELVENTKLIYSDPQSRKELRNDPALAQELVDVGRAEARRLDMENNMTKKDLEEFRQLLRKLTIPDTVNILDGEIKKDKDPAVRGSSVFRATWKGKTVAYKRFDRLDSHELDRRIRRFTRETHVWSRLKHRNIVLFHGIVGDPAKETPLGLVSAWQNNGNLLQYIEKNHGDAHCLDLLGGAAKGLEFFHTKSVWHGNIKCSNILVNDKGEGMISDFTFSHITGFNTRWSVYVSHSAPAATRWLAPERLNLGLPSGASDVYSFAMAMIECFTLKRPFAEYKDENGEEEKDRAVESRVLNCNVKRPFGARRPMRPRTSSAKFWITDELWELIQQCWADQPADRPPISYVYTRLQRASRAHDIREAFDMDPDFKDELTNPSTMVYACLEELRADVCCTCHSNYGIEAPITVMDDDFEVLEQVEDDEDQEYDEYQPNRGGS